MSSSTESIRVTIFGEEYSIKGDSDIETTQKVAEFVNKKMSDVQNGVPSRDKCKIAILSAMNIAEELFRYKEKCEQHLVDCEEIQKKASAISRKIDENVDQVGS
jgi:cell division protein ZapA